MILRSLENVVSLIPADRAIVGIVGAPGAGKSTIAEQLVAILPSAVLLPMDGFHLPQARLVELGRRERMGAWDTFDVESFIATLRAVRDREFARAPGFDREIEEAVPDAVAIPPTSLTVVVEGNYLLHDSGGWEAAAELFDLTFFVELNHAVRVARLVERHVRFGKTPDDARAWALGSDESNALIVEASAVRADHVIALPISGGVR